MSVQWLWCVHPCPSCGDPCSLSDPFPCYQSLPCCFAVEIWRNFRTPEHWICDTLWLFLCIYLQANNYPVERITEISFSFFVRQTVNICLAVILLSACSVILCMLLRNSLVVQFCGCYMCCMYVSMVCMWLLFCPNVSTLLSLIREVRFLFIRLMFLGIGVDMRKRKFAFSFRVTCRQTLASFEDSGLI